MYWVTSRTTNAAMQRNEDRYSPFGLSSSTSATLLAKRRAEVAPAGVLLDGIAGVDHVPAAVARVVEQAHHFLGRVLQIVVHGDHVGAAGVAQAGHDGVVLAEIARVLDIGQRHRAVCSSARQTSSELSGLPSLTRMISSPPSGVSRDKLVDQRPDGRGAAIHRHDDRQADARLEARRGGGAGSVWIT